MSSQSPLLRVSITFISKRRPIVHHNVRMTSVYPQPADAGSDADAGPCLVVHSHVITIPPQYYPLIDIASLSIVPQNNRDTRQDHEEGWFTVKGDA